MRTKDIFSGDSYRAIFAVLTYRLLMSRKWVSYIDIMNDALAPQKITCSVTNCENYGELKKAFMDVRNAIREVEGVDSIAEQGNNRNKRFRYVGKDDDPLRDMRNAKAIKDIRKYYEFCQDSAGFFPKAWLEYFLKDSMDLLEINKRKQEGEQIISAGVDRKLHNVEMLPYLYETIRNHKVLSVHYKPFEEEEMFLVFHPHYLKEFNGRWHLLGHAENKEPEEAFDLSIDRIVDKPQVLGDKDYIPAPTGFYNHYFDNILGTSHWKDNRVWWIHIRAYSNYMFNLTDTKPIHKSQKVSIPYGEYEDGEYGKFMVHVELNNEFIGRILQMGDGLEVVGPPFVRRVFETRIKHLADRYTEHSIAHDNGSKN